MSSIINTTNNITTTDLLDTRSKAEFDKNYNCIFIFTDPWGEGLDNGDCDDDALIIYTADYAKDQALLGDNITLVYIVSKQHAEHPENHELFTDILKIHSSTIVCDQTIGQKLLEMASNTERIRYVFVCAPLELVNGEIPGPDGNGSCSIAETVAIIAHQYPGRCFIQGFRDGYNWKTTLTGCGYKVPQPKDTEPLPEPAIGNLMDDYTIGVFTTKQTSTSFPMFDSYLELPKACQILPILKLFFLMDPNLPFAKGVLVSKDIHQCGGSGNTTKKIRDILSVVPVGTKFGSDPDVDEACDNYAQIILSKMDLSEVESFRPLLLDALEQVKKLIFVTLQNPKHAVNFSGSLKLLNNLGTAPKDCKCRHDAPKLVETPFMYDYIVAYAVLTNPDRANVEVRNALVATKAKQPYTSWMETPEFKTQTAKAFEKASNTWSMR